MPSSRMSFQSVEHALRLASLAQGAEFGLLEAPKRWWLATKEALRLAPLAQGIRLGLGGLEQMMACHERGPKGRVEWCGSGDSNPDGLAATSS